MPRPVLDARARLLERREIPAQTSDPELIRNVREDDQRTDECQHEREPVLSAISHAPRKTKNSATRISQEIERSAGKVASTIGLLVWRSQTFSRGTAHLGMSRLRLTFQQESWIRERKVC